MQRSLLLLAVISFLACPLAAQQRVPDAKTVLQEACKQAAKEKKNVFIIFHASWCGWCHKMDTAMNDASCRKFFQDNFVVRHLTVKEAEAKKNLENPGGEEMLAAYGGDKGGIPFFLIFDDKGKLLADSKIRTAGDTAGKNMGCPASDEEVAAFIALLKKTTRLQEAQLAIIETRFKKNAVAVH